jgi:hypothetical protein
MENPLQGITRYREYNCIEHDSHIVQDEFGEYIKYDDVVKLIKELKEKHELDLDKVYSEGYDKGLDAAYESQCFVKD